MKKISNYPAPKKIKSTYDEFLAEMTPQRRKEHYEGYKRFLASEFLIALISKQHAAAQEYAEMIGISPQLMKEFKKEAKTDYSFSTVVKILKKAGCEKIMLEYSKTENSDIYFSSKKNND